MQSKTKGINFLELLTILLIYLRIEGKINTNLLVIILPVIILELKPVFVSWFKKLKSYFK